MSAAEPELVVLLDDAGRDIGTCPKATVHHTDTPLHLAFSCYVVDPEGRLLLTRRAEDKVTWPGVWTNSCCGHPAPGEELGAAVRRRVRHELGLEVDRPRLLLPAFRYRAVMADGTVENEVCPVLLATSPDPSRLRPDPTEVGEAAWVDWATFREDVLASRRAVSPWCELQVAQLPDRPLADVAADDPTGLPPALQGLSGRE